MKTVLMLLAALAVPIAANAEAVTYDFTGVVANGTTFPGISIGSTVTRTYTFDYSYTNPAQSTGTVGSSAGWQAVAKMKRVPCPLRFAVYLNRTGSGSFVLHSAKFVLPISRNRRRRHGLRSDPELSGEFDISKPWINIRAFRTRNIQ